MTTNGKNLEGQFEGGGESTLCWLPHFTSRHAFYGIQAIGIEDYIKKYGQNAWRIGFNDNRLIGELNIDTGYSKRQPGEEDLRVKNLFLDQ